MSKRNRDELGKRMKQYYEEVSKTRLMRRTPVAIRIDGKAFHTVTKGFEKPFDDICMKTMQDTMKYLCEHIQGCVIGYTQSDEITLILVDYQTLATAAWYDYEVQKLCSVSASMATLAFNKAFYKNAQEFIWDIGETWNIWTEEHKKLQKRADAYQRVIDDGAMFDSRCFNIPVEEVTNLLYWRQLDSAKNSIQLLGRKYFSAKELQGKHGGEIQDMLMEQHNVNWNDLTVPQKRGSCCVRTESGWSVDKNIPEFKGEGREYVEKLIHFDDVEND